MWQCTYCKINTRCIILIFFGAQWAKHWMDTFINVTTFCGFSPILSFGRTTRAAAEKGSRSETPEFSSPPLNSHPKAQLPRRSPPLTHSLPHTRKDGFVSQMMKPGDYLEMAAHMHNRAQKRKGQTRLQRQRHLSDRCLQIHITRGRPGPACRGARAGLHNHPWLQSKRSLKQEGPPAAWGGLLTSHSQNAAAEQIWNNAGQLGLKEEKNRRHRYERGSQQADLLRGTEDLSV